MGYSGLGLTAAEVLAEINKVATCTTNKLTDARVLKFDDLAAEVSEDATKLHNNLTVLKYYSAPLNITVTTATANKTLGSVAIPNLTNRTVLEAYAGIIIQSIQESSGNMNQLVGNTFIQVDNVAAGGLINAISLPAATLGANTSAMNVYTPVVYGNIDISAKVAFNDTVSFQWTDSDCDHDSLIFWGIQSVVIIHCL